MEVSSTRPRVGRGLQMGTATPIQLLSIGLDPPIDGRMAHTQSSLQHHLARDPDSSREYRRYQRTHEPYDISLEVTSFERILALITHEGDRFRSFLFPVPDQLPFLQHNPPTRRIDVWSPNGYTPFCNCWEETGLLTNDTARR